MKSLRNLPVKQKMPLTTSRLEPGSWNVLSR
jgi:hypothetical protein